MRGGGQPPCAAGSRRHRRCSLTQKRVRTRTPSEAKRRMDDEELESMLPGATMNDSDSSSKYKPVEPLTLQGIPDTAPQVVSILCLPNPRVCSGLPWSGVPQLPCRSSSLRSRWDRHRDLPILRCLSGPRAVRWSGSLARRVPDSLLTGSPGA